MPNAHRRTRGNLSVEGRAGDSRESVGVAGKQPRAVREGIRWRTERAGIFARRPWKWAVSAGTVGRALALLRCWRYSDCRSWLTNSILAGLALERATKAQAVVSRHKS